MLDVSMLLARYEKGQLDGIVDALKVLHDQGVFVAQIAQNKQAILDRFHTESVEDLAKEILEVRQTNLTLFALHELGATIKKEVSNA